MESASKGVCRNCTPCLKEWKIMTSNIYCLDCEANFCDDCFLFHKRIPNLDTQHIILRNGEIDVWKNIPYKCKTHNKCYEFFCEDHSEVCCQVCVYLKHRYCENMKYIKENTDGQIFRKKNKRLLTKTEKQTNAIVSQIQTLERKRELNEESKLGAEKCLKDFRSRMNKMLDKLETAAKQKIQERYRSNKDALKKKGSRLEEMKTKLDELKQQLVTPQTPGKGILAFISQKGGHAQVVDVEQELLKMNKDIPQVEFQFVLDSKIEEFVQSIDIIGEVFDKHHKSVASSSEFVEDVKADKPIDGHDGADNVSYGVTSVPIQESVSPSDDLQKRDSWCMVLPRKKRYHRNLVDVVKDSVIEDDDEDSTTNECDVNDDKCDNIVESSDDEYDVDQEDVIYTDTGLNYYFNDPYEHDWKLPPPKVPYKYVCSNLYCSIRTYTNVCPDCGSKCKDKGDETRRNKTLTC